MTAPDPRADGPAVPLTEATLSDLPEAVSVPRYDRAALSPGVVHIGVGGFHRAHQAVYFDEMARRGLGGDWGLTGVGLHRPQMGEVMRAQDNLSWRRTCSTVRRLIRHRRISSSGRRKAAGRPGG